MEKRDMYVERIKNELDAVNAKITNLEVQAKGKEQKITNEMNNQIEKLKDERTRLTGELDKMKESSEEALSELSKGINKSLSDLNQAVEDAVAKFGK